MRHRRLIGVSVAALAGAAVLALPANAGASPAQSKAARARAALHTMNLHTTPKPAQGTTTQGYSFNWSGYVDTAPSSGTYSKVSAKWAEPAIKCTSEDRIVVFWVGLDGWSDNTVEQDGTLAQCFEGSAFYYTWWEMYPTNGIQVVGTTVHPGDVIAASVVFGAGTYTLAVTDTTSPANNFTTNQVCGTGLTCSNTSAEWIAERPSGNVGTYPLAQFGTWKVNTAAVSTTTTSKGNINTFPNTQLNMVDGTNSYYLAQPGTTTGKSFSDKWLNSY